MWTLGMINQAALALVLVSGYCDERGGDLGVAMSGRTGCAIAADTEEISSAAAIHALIYERCVRLGATYRFHSPRATRGDEEQRSRSEHYARELIRMRLQPIFPRAWRDIGPALRSTYFSDLSPRRLHDLGVPYCGGVE